MNFKDFYTLLESVPSKKWYHGTTVDFDKFDYRYVMTDKSNAQYGPGFYLTDDNNIARGYANGNGFLKEVILKRKTYIFNDKTKPTKLNIQKYIERMPDKLDVLSNWHESPYRAEIELYNSLKENSDTLLELIQSVWSDCYRGYESFFVKSLVMRSHVDGIIVPQQNNVNFLIAYNPDILKIVNTSIIK